MGGGVKLIYTAGVHVFAFVKTGIYPRCKTRYFFMYRHRTFTAPDPFRTQHRQLVFPAQYEDSPTH